jgi:hypothetical protein
MGLRSFLGSSLAQSMDSDSDPFTWPSVSSASASEELPLPAASSADKPRRGRPCGTRGSHEARRTLAAARARTASATAIVAIEQPGETAAAKRARHARECAARKRERATVAKVLPTRGLESLLRLTAGDSLHQSTVAVICAPQTKNPRVAKLVSHLLGPVPRPSSAGTTVESTLLGRDRKTVADDFLTTAAVSFVTSRAFLSSLFARAYGGHIAGKHTILATFLYYAYDETPLALRVPGDDGQADETKVTTSKVFQYRFVFALLLNITPTSDRNFSVESVAKACTF